MRLVISDWNIPESILVCHNQQQVTKQNKFNTRRKVARLQVCPVLPVLRYKPAWNYVKDTFEQCTYTCVP